MYSKYFFSSWLSYSFDEARWVSFIKVLPPRSATRGSSLESGGILGREGRQQDWPVPGGPTHIWAGQGVTWASTNDNCGHRNIAI